MKGNSRIILTCILTGFVLSGFGIAAEGEKKPKKKATPEMMMKRFDTDKDGKLSLDEQLAKAKDEKAKEKMTKGFKATDADQDGFISLDEMKARFEKMAARKAKGKEKKKKEE